MESQTETWTLWLDEIPRPGWANMAIDEALLERADRTGACFLRLYRWSPHCLSFGRHEPATRRYDIERIHALGLDTVRRPTGGRAVWHARELTYAVAAPCERFGSLRSAYHEIHRMLGDALSELGASVSLAPVSRAAPVDAGACFAHPSGGEVLVGGRKMVGSAQYRHGSALLQHGSILLENDQQVVYGLSRAAWPDPAPSPAGSLGRPLDYQEVADAVAHTAALQWQAAWEPIAERDEILEAAADHYPRYRSAAWTWAR
jgi:lipoate-protein ligase A